MILRFSAFDKHAVVLYSYCTYAHACELYNEHYVLYLFVPCGTGIWRFWQPPFRASTVHPNEGNLFVAPTNQLISTSHHSYPRSFVCLW